MKRYAQKWLALGLTLLMALTGLASAAIAASAPSLPPPTVEYTPIEGAQSLPPPTVEYTPIDGPSAAAPVILEPLELWRAGYEGANVTEELNLRFTFSHPVLSESGIVIIDNGAKAEFIPRTGNTFDMTSYDCTITDWKPQTAYNVTFSGFKSEAGAEIPPVTKSVFVPFKAVEPPIPKVNKVEPAASSINPKTKTLRLRFDRDVKADGNVAHLNGEEVKFRLSGKRTAVVTLPTLKPGTEYELQLDLLYTEDVGKGNAHVENENWVYTRYEFSTTGSAPADQIPFIESVSSEIAGGVPSITFNFSEVMFSFGDITLNGEKITGEEWDITGKAMILPLGGLAPNTEYTLELSGRFISDANRIRMKPAKYTFKTGAAAGVKLEPVAVNAE